MRRRPDGAKGMIHGPRRTLTIIKPDAVARTSGIVDRFERAGLKILAAKLVRLTPEQAAGFYIVHKERPFYGSLCAFMTRARACPSSSRATTPSPACGI